MTNEENLDWLYRLKSEIYVYMPKEWLIPMDNALDMAIEALSVESQEWIDKADKIDAKFGRHDYVCSKCNEYARRFVGGSEDWWCVTAPNYCPNCGAKMVKGE